MTGTAETWLVSLWSLIFVSLYFIEKPANGGKPRRIELAVLAVLFLFFSILMVAGRLILSTAIALVLTVQIGVASHAKYAHTLTSLNINDVRFAVRQGGLAFIAKAYGGLVRTALLFVFGGICFVAAVAFTSPDTAVPFPIAFATLTSVVVLVGVAVLVRGLEETRRIFLRDREGGHFLGFMASIVFALLAPWPKLTMSDVGDTSAIPPRIRKGGRRPHIVLIHHESTFDPAIYDLPVTPLINDFLRPQSGVNGRLKVDIFGGGSWITEFAVQTGLSANCFGRAAQYIFHAGEGRFGHALPLHLSGLGYQSVLATTMSRGFMNYSRFYQSIGMEHILYFDDYSPRFRDDLVRNHSDEVLYAAILDWLTACREADRPLFLNVSTNFNHGPHDREALPKKLDPGARAFAATSLDDFAYGEYFARLDFSARSYNSFKIEISRLLHDEPVLFIRYGDHQPQFVSDIPELNRRADFHHKRHQTFYAIEALGFALDATAGVGCEILDAAFLGTLALKAAELPLDALHALHFDLISECGSGYFDSRSIAKGRYHRLLLDQGLVKAQY